MAPEMTEYRLVRGANEVVAIARFATEEEAWDWALELSRSTRCEVDLYEKLGHVKLTTQRQEE
jgi:hypothetical protein